MPQWTVKLSIWMSGGTRGVGDRAQPQRQAGPANGDRRKEVDAEGLQLDGAIEPILERRDDEFAQRLGSRAGRRDDGKYDERAHSRDCYPRRELRSLMG